MSVFNTLSQMLLQCCSLNTRDVGQSDPQVLSETAAL